MNQPVTPIAPTTALASALALPPAADAPEWVHLLPAGAVSTRNGLGPYHIADPDAVIRVSLAGERGMPIDENHATDLSSPHGGAAPARGWIEDLQWRPDGIWGRVAWTAAGRALLADRAYRGISPVITHDRAGNVLAILRASLTNTPNLRGLTPVINQETEMGNLARLAAALGLDASADEAALLAAIADLQAPGAALHSEITALGAAWGVTGDAVTILADVTARAAAPPGEIAALQSELVAVTRQLNELTIAGQRERAVAFVDAAIGDGRVGVKPSRERFIAMHMENPDQAQAIIAGLPILGPSGASASPPEGGAATALNSEQAAVARALGVDPAAYLARLNAEREGRQ